MLYRTNSMKKKYLILLINSNKFILFCNFIIILLVSLITFQIHVNQKYIYVDFQASKQMNYEIKKIIDSDFKSENDKIFNLLKQMFEINDYKLLLVGNSYNSNPEKLGISFTYQITPKLFSFIKFRINEEKIFLKLNNYFDQLVLKQKREINENLLSLEKWLNFYNEELEKLDINNYLYASLEEDRNNTKYDILKTKYLIKEFHKIENKIKDKNNFTFQINETKGKLELRIVIELIIIYLILFNVAIIIIRKSNFKI